MADIRGGRREGRNIVGTATYFDGKLDSNGRKQPPFYMVDAQLDLRDPDNKPETQSNPHLESHTFVGSDGKERTAHGFRMTVGQMQAVQQAAGAENFRSVTDDNRVVAFAVKADLMEVARKDKSKTLMMNTKALSKSDFGYEPDMMKNQAALKAEAQKNVAEAKAAKAAAAKTAAAKQAETPEGPIAATPAAPAAPKAARRKSASKPKASKAAATTQVDTPAPDVDAELEG